MNTISYTTMRANLAKNMEKVCADHTPIIITRANTKPTVLLSLEDYESIMETCYLLQSPANAERLRNSINEIENMLAKKKKLNKKLIKKTKCK